MPMLPLIVAVVAALIAAGTMSTVLPRAKPQIPLPVEKPAAESLRALTSPPLPPEQQVNRLKQLEGEVKKQREQAERIDQKLDRMLRTEEAKDAVGE